MSYGTIQNSVIIRISDSCHEITERDMLIQTEAHLLQQQGEMMCVCCGNANNLKQIK